MKKVILSFLSLLAILTSISAQNGTIAGKVMESDSGFEVIGGTIMVLGTDNGTVTDFDGTYQIKIEPGTYQLEFSYVGMVSQTFDVEVKGRDLTTLDVQLGTSSIDLGLDITVTAKASRTSVAALMTLQKKAPTVVDGIGSQQIAQSGDSDVASAVRRVTGVTIEGGKYVYVRGLGDRYSKTTLNGAEIPGLDPNRNTVQMDLFPTNLVDNILVYKTFAPNLPGDFSGGLVDIATKDFPSQFTLNASVSAGFNTNVTFQDDFLTSPTSGTDFLGMDDGNRALPQIITDNQNNFPQFGEGLSNSDKAQDIANLTNSFDNNWKQSNKTPFLNTGFSVSVGDQKELFGKPLGVIAALSYDRSYNGYSNGETGIYELTARVDQTNVLTSQLSTVDQKGVEEVIWGGMLSTSLKINSNNKLGLMFMRNQSGTNSVTFQEGQKRRDDPDDIFQARTWEYLERSLTTAQANGKHVFADMNNVAIDWLASYSISQQDEPDLRFFTNRYRQDDDRYFLKPSSDVPASRFDRNLNQANMDTKVNVAIPFKQWNGLKSMLRVGGSYVFRDREFRESRYNFNSGSFSFPNGDVATYFDPENLIQANDAGYTNPGDGIYVSSNFRQANNYNADQTVMAGYLMAELPLTAKLRAVTGARVETTAVRLETFDKDITLSTYPKLDGEQKLIDQVDVLPSLNLNYEINDDMKIRMAFNRTLARPTFREIAPFASQRIGYVEVGNPDLQRTLIDNIDARWELFAGGGEMFSLSGFYKGFQNPIERTFNPEAGNTEITWRNVEDAFLFGGEIEVRKNLGFINDIFVPFSLNANFSYIYSETKISEQELALIRANDPNAEDTREMFGQAPYVGNLLLSYKSEKDLMANLAFNIVGDRITVITPGATPNYYQRPQPSLNFNIAKQFTNGFKVKLAANNLLNANYRETAEFKGVEYAIQTQEIGRTFSVSLSYNLAN
ncbi:MAG: TonB-dependent receptor [Paraglaciecola sp.]|jgi:TonB-dependent receptor